MGLSTQVYILQDFENGTAGLTLKGNWGFSESPYYFGKGLVPSENKPSFKYEFDGIEVRFFGDGFQSTAIQVALGGSPPQNTSTGNKALTYQQLYQSAILPADHHSIQLSGLTDDTWFDFLVTTPGPNSPLAGQTLMIDDSYTGIQYIGDWQTSTDEIFSLHDAFGALALMNTTHHTSTIGAGLNISYTGTSMSVFGIVSWQQAGNFSLTYSVDGGTKLVQPFVTNGTNTAQPDIIHQTNFKLAETGPLPAGNHTLSLTLNACNNQALVIDYILYTPAFDTLSAMPNLTQSLPASSTESITSPSPTGAPAPPSSTTPAGAIAGGVVGGIIILILLCALGIWCLRSKRQRGASDEAETKTQSIEPYVVQLASPASPPEKGAGTVSPVQSRIHSSIPRTSLRTPALTTAESFSNNSSSESAGGANGLAKQLQDLTHQVQQLQAMRHEGSPERSENIDELMRGYDNLSRQVEHLQSLVVSPPSYETH